MFHVAEDPYLPTCNATQMSQTALEMHGRCLRAQQQELRAQVRSWWVIGISVAASTVLLVAAVLCYCQRRAASQPKHHKVPVVVVTEQEQQQQQQQQLSNGRGRGRGGGGGVVGDGK